MRTCVRMTSQGSAYARFRRALLTKNLTLIRLAAAESLNGIRILRRGFNFVDGADGQGHLNAGLFFICFVRNPQSQFVPMQTALSRSDRMLEYVEHTSSAVFACPPGLGEGDYWGRQLLVGQV